MINLEEEDSGIGIFEIHLKFKFGTSRRLDFNMSQVAQVFNVLLEEKQVKNILSKLSKDTSEARFTEAFSTCTSWAKIVIETSEVFHKSRSFSELVYLCVENYDICYFV